MDEKLKQTIAALEKALAETEAKTAKIDTELANPFLKAELRGKYKKAAGLCGEMQKKLKTQIRGLKMLGNISSAELAEIRAKQENRDK